MGTLQRNPWTMILAAACLALVAGAAAAAPNSVATLSASASGIEFRPAIDYEKLVLTVSGPGDLSFRREFAAGEPAAFGAFDRRGQSLPDGNYTYELLAVPRFAPEVRQKLAAARKGGNERAAIAELRRAGKLPKGSVQSGGFMMESGTFIVAGLDEAGAGPKSAKEALRPIVEADQVIPDDLIVQGSGCFGFDCVNNESFGFDTIRLKENNLRIKFEDTSTGTYPTNDWQLTANDSASGGSSKFSIEDITGAKVPFTVTAGAATNSIFVDSTGRVGFRTSTPVLDLHINTSNTPAIRMEQNSSGGFTAQTWDVAGNEANFFVRDVTGGSRLPFRIRPGAPTSSVDISATGDVGVGTASPSVKLHVLGSGGTTKFLVEETNGTQTDREVAELRNNGNVAVGYKNTAVTQRWANNVGTNFLLNEQTNAGIEFTLTNTGNLTIAGTLTQNSDRTTKTDLSLVDPAAVLAKIDALPIMTWRKIGDQALHMGPMAQDFAAAFGLGEDDRQIATIDMAGASLAAIQALHQKLQERDAQIAEMQKKFETEIAQLKELLERSADQR